MKAQDRNSSSHKFNKLFSSHFLKTYLVYIVLGIICVAATAFAGVRIVVKVRNLKEAETKESVYCPFYTCTFSDKTSTKAGPCGNAPFRCLDGGTTCSDSDKICMKLHGNN